MANIKKVAKYQNAPKPVKKSRQQLPAGATSASAERDYAKSESLKKVSDKMTGMDFFKNAQAKKPSPRQQSDSLRMEGDRKTKATGGVPKSNRLNKTGGITKKKTMKTGGTLAPTKKSVGKTSGKLNKAKSGMKMSKMMSKMSKKK